MKPDANNQRVDYKFVFELRYDYGYTYLDRCGATMNDILRSHPGWEQSGATPQQGTLKDAEREITFNFNTLKLDLSQELTAKTTALVDIAEFAELASDLTSHVTARLEVQESVTRVGFRIWQLFGQYETLDAAREAVLAMKLVSHQRFQEAGINGVREASCAVMVESESRWTRIAVTAVEQKVKLSTAILKQQQKPYKLPPDQRKRALLDRVKVDHAVKSFPPFAVLVDMDHYIEYPPYPEHLNIASDLIVPGYEWSKETASKLIATGLTH